MEISLLAHVAAAASRAATGSGGLKDGTDLPALQELAKTVTDPGRVRSVLITHVLRTAVAYADIINAVYPVSAIIAISYSADPEAVRRLREKGYNVIVPATVSEMFPACEQAVVEALEASDQPLLVQEVGGYLAKYSERLGKYAHFLGVVEDTNNGHWAYERTKPHSKPVLSMARSPLKDVEDTIIGDAVLFSIERVVRENFGSVLQGSRSAVIGFGKIGTSTAVALRGRESVVSIYDINPAKNMRARVEGFFPAPLKSVLAEADLVVGCTGQTSVRLVDMEHIKDGCVLASASSKDYEFDLKGFASVCQVDKIDSVTARYRQPNGKSFYILLDGTPINFRDGSILGTILDMIYCELLVCMRYVAEGKAPVDLSNSPPAVQNEVAKAWLRAHSEDFAEATDDKVWTYPESLQLGMPKS
ncbi:MAG: NAD(P)-dependent oxidoreductase [Usitatibacteraceae bacterium]